MGCRSGHNGFSLDRAAALGSEVAGTGGAFNYNELAIAPGIEVMDTEDSSSVDERLVGIEERLAYQQHLLDQLNGVVLQQRGELDRLTRELASLRDLLADMSPGENLPYEKPPHY
jgi:SlyX protein